MPQNFIAAFKSTDAGGVQYVNTLAVGQDVPLGPDTALDYDTLANDVYTWLGTEYLAMLAPDYTLNEVHVLGILGGNGEGTKSVGAVGTLNLSGTTEHSCPKELTAVLTFKTAVAGRRGRGRIFVPSPRWAEFMSNVSQWNTASNYWTAIGAFGAKVLAGANITHGAAEHHYTGKVWSRAGNTVNDITAYIRRPEYHFLRSRRTAP